MLRFIYLQHSKLAGMFGTEAAGADNSYNSSPSHNFLTSVDDTLRADNLSPSSSQGSPARSEDQLTELTSASPSGWETELTEFKLPSLSGNDKELTELKPLMKPASNISLSEFPVLSAGYPSISSIKSGSSSPTYYNSLITPVAQTPENLSLYTPTATSSTYCSTPTPASPSHYNSLDRMTTPASPSQYNSLDRMTTPTSASSSYYSSLSGMATPTSAISSHCSSLHGMTTPYTDYPQYTTPSYVNQSSLTPPFSTSSPSMHKRIISPPQYSLGTDSNPLYQYMANVGPSPLSQHRMNTDSTPLSGYTPNGESHLSTHTQHAASRKYDTEYDLNNTSPGLGMSALIGTPYLLVVVYFILFCLLLNVCFITWYSPKGFNYVLFCRLQSNTKYILFSCGCI